MSKPVFSSPPLARQDPVRRQSRCGGNVKHLPRGKSGDLVCWVKKKIWGIGDDHHDWVQQHYSTKTWYLMCNNNNNNNKNNKNNKNNNNNTNLVVGVLVWPENQDDFPWGTAGDAHLIKGAFLICFFKLVCVCVFVFVCFICTCVYVVIGHLASADQTGHRSS